MKKEQCKYCKFFAKLGEGFYCSDEKGNRRLEDIARCGYYDFNREKFKTSKNRKNKQL